MRSTSHVRAATVAALIALWASACGSTVPLDQGEWAANAQAPPGFASGSASGAPEDQGLTVPSQSSQPLTSDRPNAGGADVTVPGGPTSGPPAPNGGGAPEQGSGSPPPQEQGQAPQDEAGPGDEAAPEGETAPAGRAEPAADTRGVSDDTILIGVPHLSRDQSEVLANAGLGSPGDTKRMAQILIDDINSRGGIAGRQLEPIFAESAGSTSTEENDQASCATWTQDNQVFAVVAYVAGGNETIAACLAQADTPLVSNFVATIVDEAMLERYAGYLYPPSVVNLDRAAQIYVDGLAELGYFEAQDSVYGLLRIDRPQFDRVTDQVLKPALARHGINLEEDFRYDPANTNWANNAVLQFKASGVSHVLMLNFEVPLLFMTAAESQAYRPRYGLSTYQTPQFAAETAPSGQLRGAIGVGWWPVYDDGVDEGTEPTNAATKRCLDLMRSKGQDVSGQLTQLSALITCDSFFFFEHAMNRATQLSPSGLRQAVEGLGTSYVSPLTFATRFDAQHRDGATQYRDLAFDDACRCFGYTSPPKPLP